MDAKNKKIGKYLTDIKELPTESADEDQKPVHSFKAKVEEVSKKPPVQVEEVKKPEVKPEVKKEIVEKDQGMEIEDFKKDEPQKDDKTSKQKAAEPETEIIDKPYTPKDIILGVINILSVIFLIFLLINLPKKADELKKLRIDEVKNSAGVSADSISDDNVKRSAELKNLFLDDFGVVNFTVDIEKLKSQNPAIQKVTFTSQKPIKDRLGLSGIPVVIVIQGNWNTIAPAMNAIESLPYLFRPVSIKTDQSKDDPNVIVLNYGGLLYVGDKFTKN